MSSLGTVAECGEKDGETAEGIELAEIDKTLLSEEDQQKYVKNWKFQTDDDYIKYVEEIMKHAEKDREKFSINPSGWLKEYVKDWKFETDDEYIKFVREILKQAKNRTLRNKTCPPFWIAVALITEDHLKNLKDTMASVMKLQFLIRELEKQSDDLYHEHYQILLAVPVQFAVSLLDECLSPDEVKILMKIEDMTSLDKTVLKHLQLAKIKGIVARPLYRSVYSGVVFWHDYESGLGSSSPFSRKGLTRFILLVLWNVLYLPAEVIRRLCKSCIKLDDSTIGRFYIKYDFHKRLFSPVSFFFADLVNYIIMTLLLFTVISHSHIRSRQEATRDLVNQLKHKEITIDEDSRFIIGSDGIVKVQLEMWPIKPIEWALLACIISRILCEVYQLVNEKVVSLTASSNEDIEETLCCCFYKKIMQYIKKDMNKIDCALMVTLLVAFSIKLHYVYQKAAVYGRVCLMKDGCKDDGLDYSLEARRIVYTIHVYSIAGLLTLVRMFYSIFLFLPLIGPILRSIQMMLRDVAKVVIILLFFSAGFFVPLYAIIHCYRAVHSDSEEKEPVFKTMRSPSVGVFTMVLSMLEGKLTYAKDVYSSKDPSTSVFLSGILFMYYILIGLLCLNLLIGLITKRYDTMMESQDRDWRFAQFDFLMDYDATNPENGMPFYFPFCIVYITWCLGRMIVTNCLQCSRKKKNCSEKEKNVSGEVGGPLSDDAHMQREELLHDTDSPSSVDTRARGEDIVLQVHDNPTNGLTVTLVENLLKRRDNKGQNTEA